MKKDEAQRFLIVVLQIICIYLLLISCENEPVGFPITQECCTHATIFPNSDFPGTGNKYEGDFVEWMTLRDWSDGQGFLIRLEDCETQEYLGAYIIRMYD